MSSFANETLPFSTLPPISSMMSQAPETVPHNGFIFGQYPMHQHAFRPDIPIDPALIPLPHDEDLNDASTSVPVAIRLASGSHRLVVKVAGSRRKMKEPINKGKKRADETSTGTKSSKRGRPSGAANFSDHDIWALLDAVESELPLGERGWKAVQALYNKYSQERGRPQRSHKSLETKFKQFIRKGKPTGVGECPPHIERAFEVEEKINERAGTRDVNDSQLDEPVSDTASITSDRIEISSNDEQDKTVATVKRAASPVLHRKQKTTGVGLMKKIADSLDPSTQRQRDNDRAGHNLSAVQILTLSQQLRDAHQVAHTLRSEITQLLTRVHTAESARERLELKLEFLGFSNAHNTRKRFRTHRQETITRPSGDVEVISLTDTDSLSSDHFNKENRPPGRAVTRRALTRVRPRPFPMKLEELETLQLPFQNKTNYSDDTDLPSPSIAFLTNPSNTMVE